MADAIPILLVGVALGLLVGVTLGLLINRPREPTPSQPVAGRPDPDTVLRSARPVWDRRRL